MYPKELILKDSTRVILRPIEQGDLENLSKFFSKIPGADLLIYKDDVRKLETIESWFTSSMYNKVLQLVALKSVEIIAKGTLHKEGLYWQHAVEIKLIVDPDYRGRGLGSQIFKTLLAEGLRHSFEKIIVRFTPDNKSFTRILGHFGFKPEAVLNCYVKCEETGKHKDLVIASYNLQDWERRFEFYNLYL
jgi:RimJ/RimL family protein N-acetyltransferase